MIPIVLADVQTRFNPRRIPGLYFWLAADRIVGLGDGDAITTWSDLSPNGIDFTQSVEAKRPQLKLDILNGRAVVRFDGDNDFLTVTFSSALTQPNSVGVVFAHRSGVVAASEQIIVGRDSPLTTSSHGIYARNATPDKIAAWSGLAAEGPDLDTSFHIGVAVFDNTSSIFRVDGVDYSANTGSLDVADYGLGADPGGAGSGDVDIAEVLFYSEGISTGYCNRLEKYLSIKYGISI